MPIKLTLKPGATVLYAGRHFIIRQVLDAETALAQDPETNVLEHVPISSLCPFGTDETTAASQTNLVDRDHQDWEEARRRLELLTPMLEGARYPRALVVERARAAGIEATTLYRWASTYRACGLLSSLLPHKPSGGRGKSCLDPAVENILTQTIEEHYLTRQQRTIHSTAMEVARRCREAKLTPPDTNTVRLRIRALPTREKLARLLRAYVLLTQHSQKRRGSNSAMS